MSRPRSVSTVALEDRDLAVILTLAATLMCPLAALHVIHFPGVALRIQRKRIAILLHTRLVKRVNVAAHGQPLRRRRVLVYLSKEGWQMAGTLGAAAPPLSAQQLATVVPGSVALVADAYAMAATSALLDKDAQWELCPRSPHGYAPMPEGVLALLQREQELLAFDLDLPGRSLAQVEDRLKTWHHFVVACREKQSVTVCYVVTAHRRRQQIEALRSKGGWDWLQLDMPDSAVCARFLIDTPGG